MIFTLEMFVSNICYQIFFKVIVELYQLSQPFLANINKNLLCLAPFQVPANDEIYPRNAEV